ncbi:MAG: carboxy-S-adenosyl-L-methionine synthase CmoA [Deltaproteobacteria bacterium]|nr:carboxy-S-adenosyl-L-methionine synthase CmoA [Deltaproteobacteria bacterium]
MTFSDHLFAQEQRPVPPFRFDERVAQVFDNMIRRSVPLYQEILRGQAELAACFYQDNTVLYDLGCSNGNFELELLEVLRRPLRLIAVDSSAAMLESLRSRCPSWEKSGIELRQADISKMELETASVVVLNLTLQFVPPPERELLLRKIHAALQPGGILLLTEKVIHADARLAQLQQRFYYDFKRRQGYSELEIAQKREALENVLIPETVEKHLARLHGAGFAKVDIWMKWFNFAAFLAIRE